jgi:hypothetical protein
LENCSLPDALPRVARSPVSSAGHPAIHDEAGEIHFYKRFVARPKIIATRTCESILEIMAVVPFSRNGEDQ